MRNQRTPRLSQLFVAILCLVGVLACSTSRSGGAATNLVNAQGTHPVGFINSHPGVALASIEQCKTCHGQDLAGGIAKTTCFTAACHHDPVPGWALPGSHGLHAKQAPDGSGRGFGACQICHGATFAAGLKASNGTTTACTTCHGVAAPHPPKPWHNALGSNHASTDPGNAVVCAKCHFPGAPANPAGHPATPAPSGTTPGCFNNTMCHGNSQAPHGVPFLDTSHTGLTQSTFTANCASCHAVSGTSPVPAAPLCGTCHQAGSPLTQAGCTSCHGKPPAGTVYPNVAGVHAKHNALTTVAGVCGSCHQGSDTGSLAHYDAANGRPGKNANRIPPGQVAFLAAFNATSGAASFNPTAQTCSNVSCHGGQVTPSWATGGTINPATDCAKCHAVGIAAGLPQANSASSGFHALHMNSTAGIQCAECHAMANGTAGALNHFTALNTPQLEGPASQTVAFTGGTYNATALTCTVTCHGKVHGSYTWTGTGGVHPAGWISSHPSGALAGVNACKTCHGAQLLGGPWGEPSCSTTACHHDTLPGYALAGNHGVRAKAAQGATGGGLVSCQLCHGTNFATGLTAKDGSTKACTTCHGVAAPHPAKPWHNVAGSNHATTDTSNAPVCVQCHFPGSPSNPPGHPAVPAPAGTAPGCFNNTMCHGTEAAPHVLGAVWKDATSNAFHGFQAKQDLAYCQNCHGTPGTTSFDGGSSTTKCSTCHTQAKAHANVWYKAPVATFPGYVPSHRNAGNRDVACAICHDGTKGRTAPDPIAPSCFSATANSVACHVNGPGQPNHPVPYLNTTHTAVTQVGFDSNCGVCHSVSGTSPATSAPLCSACHQAGSPLTLANCTSCHAKPPTGSAFPNVAGRHATHNALANVTGACSACHQGSDSGSLTHYDHANGRAGHSSLRAAPGEVATDPVYNAKTGTAAFNAGASTCSNVSCHGSQTTPSWLTGTLASNNEAGCRACHTLGTAQGTPQNNSAYSGLHALHLNSTQNLQCVECHNMANGTTGAQNHFKFLNTAQMEGPPGQTVAFNTTTPAATYNIATQSCGTGGAFSCHGHAHGATYTWTGGGGHVIPYTGTAHTSVNTQVAFTNTCGNCHAVTGTSPSASAPLCITCHQAGSPLTLGNCTSCHSRPPIASTFPDIAGSHSKHNALTGVTGLCSSCHNNSDAGTQVHYDHANARPGMDTLRVSPGETAFLTVLNGKTGTATFDPAALTCSNVSCHGGLTTPNWRIGTLAVNTEAGCRACHSLGTAQGVPQNNSAYSGQHAFHLGAVVNAQCVECHSMTNGSTGATNHFTSLTTPQMEGPASGTVSLPAGGTYTVANQTCNGTCHGQTHVNFPWAGGANHVMPFSTTAHTSVNQAGFDATCSACHAATGGVSPMTTAPTCVTCHTAGSPLTVTNCASCHGKPPTGAAFPNIAGKHAKHNALAGFTGACVDCHNGVDTGSTIHYNHGNNRPGLNGARVAPGEVAFPGTTYNAKTGTAAFNSTTQTCSNVSCHGGQTVAWSATITVNTQCTTCHTNSGTTQYNSPASGDHSTHAGKNVGCVQCHNVTKLATSHFVGLKTTAMDSVAARASLGGTTQLTSYNTTARTCLTTCHGADKVW